MPVFPRHNERHNRERRGIVLTEFCFALVAFVTHLVQGITGFGSTVLAMPFVVNLVDARVAIPVLTLLSLFFSSGLVLLDRGKIVWREVFLMTGFMAIGAPVGIYFFKHLPKEVYKPAMGTLIVVIALWGLLRFFSARAASIRLPRWLRRALLVVGGVTQGAFGSSGPFAVLYAEGALTEKSEFRTTMSAMWILINLIVLPQYFWAGIDVAEVSRLTAVSLPAIFLGLAAGMLLHRKIPQRGFSLLIYFVLLLSGLFNLIY